jgi:Zincin-like metallopeptidase
MPAKNSSPKMSGAFVCTALSIAPTVRHANYLASRLEVLHEDNRAIIRAASAASKAADYLLAFRDRELTEDPVAPPMFPPRSVVSCGGAAITSIGEARHGSAPPRQPCGSAGLLRPRRVPAARSQRKRAERDL